MKSKWLLALVLAALALITLPAVAEQTAPPVAGVTVGGAFTLTDHHGAAVTEKSWPQKSKLVFFGFTHCPDICPAALQKVAAVMETLDPKGERFVPLFITLDPKRDTTSVLSEYVKLFTPHLIGLTGTEEQVKAVEKVYKVYASKSSNTDADYMVNHSGYIYFMSPDDQLLEVFSSDETTKNIIGKIRLH